MWRIFVQFYGFTRSNLAMFFIYNHIAFSRWRGTFFVIYEHSRSCIHLFTVSPLSPRLYADYVVEWQINFRRRLSRGSNLWTSDSQSQAVLTELPYELYWKTFCWVNHVVLLFILLLISVSFNTCFWFSSYFLVMDVIYTNV